MNAIDLTADGWIHAYSGKVRDLYIETGVDSLDSATRVLMVASDRVSAFDHVLSPGIPGKGDLLTTLSLWWFDQLTGVPNHLIADHELNDAGTVRTLIPATVAGRAMLARTLRMFPIECVVRGYLAGSGWLEYQKTQSVCGVALPAGLANGDRLPEPIYTPAWKAPQGEHDENISFERTVELVGVEVAEALRDLSLEIFGRASAIAEARGVILADTKFEFGANRDTGVITLGDEVLTSDSSRFWDAANYVSSGGAASSGGANRQDSFDKQIVRNWLADNWDASAGADSASPPVLPDSIVRQTAARYRELIEKLTD